MRIQFVLKTCGACVDGVGSAFFVAPCESMCIPMPCPSFLCPAHLMNDVSDERLQSCPR